MLRIGLTGGIGAGKSVVSAGLAQHGAVVIDADRIAREVLEPGTAGLTAVVAAFGPTVLRPDGTLDRELLASLVFGDDAARAQLNAIVHPLVAARSGDLIATASQEAVVVHDVPLLVENDLAAHYHLVIVVEAPEELRLNRLRSARGMSPESIRARMAAQATDDQRRLVADVLLRNDGTLPALHERVDALWTDRLVPFAANLVANVVPPRPPRIVEYDPTWPEQYVRVEARLVHTLGRQALRIDHIGSTAVPGLAAKNIIDVQVATVSLAAAEEVLAALHGSGWVVRADVQRDHVPPFGPSDLGAWAKRLACYADPGRPANLHIRVLDAVNWRYALLFRDYLRTHPAEAAHYEREKWRLAAAHPDDSMAYADAKDPVVDAIMVRAEEWVRTSDWRP